MTDQPTPLPEPEFSWHAHPAAERPGAAAGAAAAIAGLSGAAWLGFGPGWSAATAVVLVLSLRRFFFRSDYAIDGAGITARSALSIRRLRWTDARRFLVDAHGGFLSTRARHSWLAAGRGLHVLFGRHRDEAIERIAAHVRARAAAPVPPPRQGAPSWAR